MGGRGGGHLGPRLALRNHAQVRCADHEIPKIVTVLRPVGHSLRLKARCSEILELEYFSKSCGTGTFCGAL